MLFKEITHITRDLLFLTVYQNVWEKTLHKRLLEKHSIFYVKWVQQGTERGVLYEFY